MSRAKGRAGPRWKGETRKQVKAREAREKRDDSRHQRNLRYDAYRSFQTAQDEAIASYARAESQRAGRSERDTYREIGRSGRAFLDRWVRGR